MSIAQEPKKRKRKVRPAQTYSGRRQADRARLARSAWRQRHFKFRVKVVRYYRKLRRQMAEQQAAEMTLERWQARESWHFPLCLSSIRQWHRTAKGE